MKHPDSLYIVTGGPGSGKSTLIEALESRGYARSLEAGRGIIQDQMAIDGPALPWRDPLLFAELMLNWEMRSYHAAQAHAGPVLFDRGVPDVIGYLTLCGLPVPAHFERAAARFRYHKVVFIAPPWPQIFPQDAERRQSPEEAEQTYAAMVRTYTSRGYTLVELPRASIEDRVGFVVERIGPAGPRG
jgi:predicted ATPase